jgi:hypothetical protein
VRYGVTYTKVTLFDEAFDVLCALAVWDDDPGGTGVEGCRETELVVLGHSDDDHGSAS